MIFYTRFPFSSGFFTFTLLNSYNSNPWWWRLTISKIYATGKNSELVQKIKKTVHFLEDHAVHESNLTAVQHFEKVIDPRCKVIVTAVLVSKDFDVNKEIKAFYKAIFLLFWRELHHFPLTVCLMSHCISEPFKIKYLATKIDEVKSKKSNIHHVIGQYYSIFIWLFLTLFNPHDCKNSSFYVNSSCANNLFYVEISIHVSHIIIYSIIVLLKYFKKCNRNLTYECF